MAQLSKAFGTKIIYYNRTRQQKSVEDEYSAEYQPLDELLQKADIISVHLPLTDQTRNFIDEKQIELMKDIAVIINVGRGGLINEDALYNAMKNGCFLGAGIDVWEHEPFDAGNKLIELPNVIATPHIGGGTQDAMRNVYQICFEKIMNVCKNSD